MQPADALDPVREAKLSLGRAMGYLAGSGTFTTVEDAVDLVHDAIYAFESAVEARATAAERARLRGLVEGMREDEDKGNSHDEWWAIGHNAALDTILTLLDGAPK